MVSLKLNTITVCKHNDGYVATISNGHAIKTVSFTNNREVTSVENIELIEQNSFEQYVTKKYDEVIADLGEPHTDIGSGFYIPTYLTSNARLVSFYIENECVSAIWIRDLFSGEVILKAD